MMRDYAIRVRRRPGMVYRARLRAEVRGVLQAAAIVLATVVFGLGVRAAFMPASAAGSAGAAASRGGVAALRPSRLVHVEPR